MGDRGRRQEVNSWCIGNGQIVINCGKDLVVLPDFYGGNSYGCFGAPVEAQGESLGT